MKSKAIVIVSCALVLCAASCRKPQCITPIGLTAFFPYEEGDVIKLIGQTGDTIVFKFASKNEYYTYEESEYKCGWHELCCVFTDSTEGRLDFNGETEIQSRTGEMPGKGYMQVYSQFYFDPWIRYNYSIEAVGVEFDERGDIVAGFPKDTLILPMYSKDDGCLSEDTGYITIVSGEGVIFISNGEDCYNVVRQRRQLE